MNKLVFDNKPMVWVQKPKPPKNDSIFLAKTFLIPIFSLKFNNFYKNYVIYNAFKILYIPVKCIAIAINSLFEIFLNLAINTIILNY
jgi:hypothetical protein